MSRLDDLIADLQGNNDSLDEVKTALGGTNDGIEEVQGQYGAIGDDERAAQLGQARDRIDTAMRSIDGVCDAVEEASAYLREIAG